MAIKRRACNRCDGFGGYVGSEYGEVVDGGLVIADEGPVRVVFVGEAPGADEEESGRPFIGDAGQVLRDAIPQVLGDGDRFLLTSVCKCRPPGDKKPVAKEVKACRPRLLADLKKADPEMVVVLGGTALKALTGETKITSWAGVKTEGLVEGLDCPVFPMYSPAYPLHDASKWPEVESQFERLAIELGEAEEMEMPEVVVIDDPEDLEQYDWPRFAIDFETTGLDPIEDRVRLISLSGPNPAAKTGYDVLVVNYEGMTPKQQSRVNDIIAYKVQTMAFAGRVVAHNKVFERRVCRHQLGFEADFLFCSMIAHSVLYEEATHGLDAVWASFGGSVYSNEVRGYLARGIGYDVMPIDVLIPYAGLDAWATIRITEEWLVPELEETDLDLLSYTFRRCAEMDTVADMIDRGLYVDVKKARAIKKRIEDQRDRLLSEFSKRDEVQKLMGVTKGDLYDHGDEKKNGELICKDGVFNPRSSIQRMALFFHVAGLDPIYDTNGKAWRDDWRMSERRKPSTKGEYLEQLDDQTGLVEEFMAITDCDGTLLFLNQSIEAAGQNDRHVVRANFRGDRVVTGRLSCSDPNLQGVKKSEAQNIFVSRFGLSGRIVSADYEQLELRLWASVAGDPVFLKVFSEGGDPHRSTGATIHAIEDEEDVNDEQRSKGKRLNFGLTYGITIEGIAKKFHVTLEAARRLHDRFWDHHKEAKAWVAMCVAEARSNGCVYTPAGRRRVLKNIHSDKWWLREKDERVAANVKIQNAGGEITLWAMWQIDKRLKDEGYQAVVVGQVHDSVVVDCPGHELVEVKTLVREVMEQEIKGEFPWLEIDLPVDLVYGPSWGEPVKRIKV